MFHSIRFRLRFVSFKLVMVFRKSIIGSQTLPNNSGDIKQIVPIGAVQSRSEPPVGRRNRHWTATTALIISTIPTVPDSFGRLWRIRRFRLRTASYDSGRFRQLWLLTSGSERFRMVPIWVLYLPPEVTKRFWWSLTGFSSWPNTGLKWTEVSLRS